MKIEVGKFYRSRDGQKARIYATDGGFGNQIHGAVLRSDECWILMWWRVDGKCPDDKEFDIISEWTESLDFDPSCLPAWAEWIAMDENKRWYYYGSEPKPLGHYWGGNLSGLIPAEYAPNKYEGGIEDSLHNVSDLKNRQS